MLRACYRVSASRASLAARCGRTGLLLCSRPAAAAAQAAAAARRPLSSAAASESSRQSHGGRERQQHQQQRNARFGRWVPGAVAVGACAAGVLATQARRRAAVAEGAAAPATAAAAATGSAAPTEGPDLQLVRRTTTPVPHFDTPEQRLVWLYSRLELWLPLETRSQKAAMELFLERLPAVRAKKLRATEADEQALRDAVSAFEAKRSANALPTHYDHTADALVLGLFAAGALGVGLPLVMLSQQTVTAAQAGAVAAGLLVAAGSFWAAKLLTARMQRNRWLAARDALRSEDQTDRLVSSGVLYQLGVGAAGEFAARPSDTRLSEGPELYAVQFERNHKWSRAAGPNTRHSSAVDFSASQIEVVTDLLLDAVKRGEAEVAKPGAAASPELVAARQRIERLQQQRVEAGVPALVTQLRAQVAGLEIGAVLAFERPRVREALQLLTDGEPAWQLYGAPLAAGAFVSFMWWPLLNPWGWALGVLAGVGSGWNSVTEAMESGDDELLSMSAPRRAALRAARTAAAKGQPSLHPHAQYVLECARLMTALRELPAADRAGAQADAMNANAVVSADPHATGPAPDADAERAEFVWNLRNNYFLSILVGDHSRTPDFDTLLR